MPPAQQTWKCSHCPHAPSIPRDFLSVAIGCVYLSPDANVRTGKYRKRNTLDLCYGNIVDAFAARSYPPLGSLDHNVLVFLPQYKQELKHNKPQVHSAAR